LIKFVCKKELPKEIIEAKDAIEAIYKELQKQRKHADNTDLMVEINGILSDYITINHNEEQPSRQFDISKIDFDLLRREFAKVQNKHLMLKDLDELVQERLDRMLRSNPSRVNFYERYKAIIEDYNKEQDRAVIEKTFNDLMALVSSLSEEEHRYVREEFQNDAQLAIFDLMFQDDLSAKDIKKIKEVSVELLEKIKAAVASFDHCFDKEEGQSAVQVIIRDTLFEELPESVYPNFEVLRIKIYDYVKGLYENAA